MDGANSRMPLVRKKDLRKDNRAGGCIRDSSATRSNRTTRSNFVATGGAVQEDE
eukprot:m.210438 g.210438  ORF g.210438 m.210438 type:complete len:54 (-) comp25489_c1_seq26:794-955(-)